MNSRGKRLVALALKKKSQSPNTSVRYSSGLATGKGNENPNSVSNSQIDTSAEKCESPKNNYGTGDNLELAKTDTQVAVIENQLCLEEVTVFPERCSQDIEGAVLIDPDQELLDEINQALSCLDSEASTSNVFLQRHDKTLENAVIEGNSPISISGDVGDTYLESDEENRVDEETSEEELSTDREDSSNSNEDSGNEVYKENKNQTRKKRQAGEKYLGYRRVAGKIFHDANKPARKIGARCPHKTLEKTGLRCFFCDRFTDGDRTQIFNSFWNDLKTWSEKKAHVMGLVSRREIIRRRKKRVGGLPKKNVGYDIFLEKPGVGKLRVCRNFFLSTLNLGRDTFLRWMKNKRPAAVEGETEIGSDGHTSNASSLQPPRKRIRTENIEKVKEWLALLPKVPSHYCRASTSRIYVESTFRSTMHMHQEYKSWCEENHVPFVGRITFTKVLNAEKISIHHPRKDQCDTCCGFKTGSVSGERYNEHVKKKDELRQAKNDAKASASSKKLVVTMDLQSVLLCPKTLASAMYYKQKLQVHNFTVYELNESEVVLYVWHEANGGVSSNEFTSCIIDYLSNIPETYDEVVLISDGCNYQNRNKVLASALSDLAMRRSIIIQQLFLEKGHTMMEADSVHATLEQYFKPPINSPSDYVSRMRLARPKQPYHVKVLDYNFFLNYENLKSNLLSIRPGKKAGDPTVTDIRQLKFLPSGEIQYQLDCSGNWQVIPHRRSTKNVLPKKMYKSQLPIAESKYRHLQELKSVIEKDHHAFYDALNFKKD